MKILHLLLHLIISPNYTPNYITYPSYFGTKTRLEFNESCLKQDKITYINWKIVKIYIVYEISKNYNINFIYLKSCLFDAVTLTENADIDILDMVLSLIEKNSFQ